MGIQPFYYQGLKKIVILGPESTGKSTLTKQLAEHFQCDWVPECARQYIDQLDRPYEKTDLLEIAKGQLHLEDEAVSKTAGNLLFYDTNLIVIKVWSDFKYGRTHPGIEEQLHLRTYDHYLLTDIDLPWEADPQREHPDKRKELFDIYESYLRSRKLPYSIIRGNGSQRFTNARNELKFLIPS